MAPKAKVTREEIVEAAVGLVREVGRDALNARSLATRLGCSTQPIFSNFRSMQDLERAVIEEAERRYCLYTTEEIGSGKYPPYKASGMAYIRFAGDEPELFRLLFMRDRSEETVTEHFALEHEIGEMVSENTGLTGTEAQLFHLEMWAFVHGIATMVATSYLELDRELVSRMLTDCYQGIKAQHEEIKTQNEQKE